MKLLSLTCATENVDQLVTNDLFDVCSCGLEIFSGVELGGLFVEELTDGTGHCKTKVGVDVDLTNGERSSLAELIFGNTDCIGHLTAVLVNHLNVFLRNGGRTVKNDGEAGKSLGYFFQHVKAKCGGNQDALFVYGALLGSEFVSAVAGTDGDCQRVTTGLGYKFFYFFRTGVGSSFSRNVYLVFDTGKATKFSFYYNAVSVSVFNYLLGDCDVLLEALGGGVDHDGSEAAVDAGLAGLE